MTKDPTQSADPGLAEAVAALCQLSGRLREGDRPLIMPALVLLSEALAQTAEQPQPSRKQTQVERLAKLEQQLQDREPGERAATIRARLGLSKSSYYRLRLEAQER